MCPHRCTCVHVMCIYSVLAHIRAAARQSSLWLLPNKLQLRKGQQEFFHIPDYQEAEGQDRESFG